MTCHGKGVPETDAEKQERFAKNKATVAGIGAAVDAANAEGSDGHGLKHATSVDDLSDPRAKSNSSYREWLTSELAREGANVRNTVQYDACADWVSDFVGEGWNGPSDPRDRDGPRPNPYGAEALPAFAAGAVSKPVPAARDAPDTLVPLESVKGRDSSGDRSKYMWAPQGSEDPAALPFSFAFGGPGGINFYNQAHEFETAYVPESSPIVAALPNLETASWLYLHKKMHETKPQEVTIGDLVDPTDIVLELETEREVTYTSACWLGTTAMLTGKNFYPFRATLGDWPGVGHTGYHVASLFDVDSGDVIRHVPIMRLDPESMLGVSWGVPQGTKALVADPTRANTAYMCFDNSLVIFDGREKRMARWHTLPKNSANAANELLLRDSGNANRILIKGEHLQMFDLVAGKLVHQHTGHGDKKKHNWQSMSTYGEHIGVSLWDEDEPLLWYSWDNFEKGSFFQSKCAPMYGVCGGENLACNSRGVYRTIGKEVYFGEWQEPIAALGGVARISKLAEAAVAKAAPKKKGRRKPARSATKAASALDAKLDVPCPTVGINEEKRDYGMADAGVFQSEPEMPSGVGGPAFWAPEGTVDVNSCPYRFIKGGRGKLALVGLDHKLELYDVGGDEIQAIAAHPKSGMFAFTTKDKIRFRKLGDAGNDVKVVESSVNTQDFCAFTSDGLMLLTCSSDGNLTVWDVASARRLSQFMPTGSRQQWFDIVADPNRPKVMYASTYGKMFQLDLDQHLDKVTREFVHPQASDRPKVSIAVQDTGACDKVAICGCDELLIFDIKTGARIAKHTMDKGYQFMTWYGPYIIVTKGKIIEGEFHYYTWENSEHLGAVTSSVHSASPHSHTKFKANSGGILACSSDRKVQLFEWK